MEDARTIRLPEFDLEVWDGITGTWNVVDSSVILKNLSDPAVDGYWRIVKTEIVSEGFSPPIN